MPLYQNNLMTREEIRARIEEIGIIPAIRVSTAEDALFAAEAVCEGAIPIVEVTMTVPGAVDVIRELTRHHPDVLVGAGTLFRVDTARFCQPSKLVTSAVETRRSGTIMLRKRKLSGLAVLGTAVASAALVLAACGSSSTPSTTSSSTTTPTHMVKVSGGTMTIAENAAAGPNYIFPDRKST